MLDAAAADAAAAADGDGDDGDDLCDIFRFSGSRPLVVAFDRCSKLLLLMHRCDVTFTSDAMLEQIIVNLLPFLKEIRSRFIVKFIVKLINMCFRIVSTRR